MKRHTFGAGLSFGAFQPTHTGDQVAEALRGHLSADELAETARQLVKAVKRRNRSRKDSTHLSTLLALVDKASRPPALTGPLEVFDRPTGGEPLEVVLMGGPNIGDRVTQVPSGTEFVVPDHDGRQLFMRYADTDGPDGLVLTGGSRDTVIRVAEETASGPGGYVVQMSAAAAAGETPC